ncbi:hypothetical protein DSECCO2_120220 [anaerobic digester metagenome]
MTETLTLKALYDSGTKHEFEFYNYICEDKSKYKTATDAGFTDYDNDFLIGESGGFLFNLNFVFVNTEVFCDVGRFHEENKYYCPYEKNSPEYKQFWARETQRRRKGMTANCKLYHKDIAEYINPDTTDERRKALLHPLRITGDHYNFLNYGRIFRSRRQDEIDKLGAKAGKLSKKIYGFPNLVDGQYWNFKIDEFIYNNNYHLCKSKARRKGFSFMRGSQAANTLNLNKDLTVMLAAYELTYLTDPGATTDMVKRNLDWYETQTYWRRNYLSEDYNKGIELGYKIKGEAHKKFGFRSKLLSVGVRGNTSAAVGKDPFELDCEESGKFPNLEEFLNVTISATEDGDSQVGTIRLYGTGGTKDSNWEAFSKYFFNPRPNKMMPFENVWDSNLRHTVCGFFYPQIWGYGSFVDEFGNAILISAWEHDSKRKADYAREINNEYKNTIFVGQRANRPSEAFLNTQENIFASEALNKWITRLKYDPDVKFYKDGLIIEEDDTVVFKTNETLKENKVKIHPYIEDYPINRDTDITGCIRMFYEPYKTNGIVPPDTYFISSDSVGIDKDKKELTLKHSLNSFKVWTYYNNGTNIPGRRLVASYCGRDNTLKEYDERLRLACLFWNARIIPEVNRGETVANFKAFKMLSRIIKDPTALIAKGRYAPNAGHGITIGDSDKKIDGLRMIKELVYTKVGVDSDGNDVLFLHYIYDLPFLLELQAFNLTGNFDRISDAIVAMFEFKAEFIKEEHKQKTNKDNSKRNMFKTLLYG